MTTQVYGGNGSDSMRRVGVMVVGAAGAVSSTIMAGVIAARRRLVEPIGMVTEDDQWSSLELAPLDGMTFSGWDVATGGIVDAVRQHRVVPPGLLHQIEDDLAEIVPYPGLDRSAGFAEGAARLVADVEDFRARSGVDEVVVVNLMSTAPPVDLQAPALQTLEAFRAGLERNDPAIAIDAIYAYAALTAGCPIVNFTPNTSAEIPALLELAEANLLPVAGKDGKTGQTLVKTVLAPMLVMRRLQLVGWYSTNILGNGDGKALSDPNAVKSKIDTKSGVLEEILGRSDFSHLVRIDYFPPSGDAKEAWDSVHFAGWLGERMSMRIDWQGKDSILAAPLIVDLVRLVDLAHRQGRAGVQEQLACFFKAPYGCSEHDFFRQYETLVSYLSETADLELTSGQPA